MPGTGMQATWSALDQWSESLPCASFEARRLAKRPPTIYSRGERDFDVQDAATWSSIAVLSEKSVADRSRPVDFPDFTKGKWKTNPPIKLMGV